MDFARFSGEFFIYYVLIALGGGVITFLAVVMFSAIGIDISGLAKDWVLPYGAMGAVIVSAWLVETSQGGVGNIAPGLARVFTPLASALLLAFLATLIWTGRSIDADRESLISFNLLLALVLGLMLYSVSARGPQAPPNIFDGLQALTAIAARISEFDFSANKPAALGENFMLLVNLVWSAWLYARFLSGSSSFSALERWQAAYLPVYALWAALVAVAVAFPPLFSYA